jgi:DNA-binding CsgD family transcriptional regulator
MRRYRTAIIEPASVIGEGIASMLSASGEVEILFCCRSIAEAKACIRSHDEVELLFVAASLAPQLNGMPLFDNVPVIAIQSTLVESEALRRFAAVVTTFSTTEELLRTLHETLDRAAEPGYNESHELSERERDVLVLVARGYTNKEIASELNISPHTVISHRKNIVHKTGIRSVAGLTVYAVLNKLITNEQL